MTRVAVVLNPVSPRSSRALEGVRRACADAGLEPPLVLRTTVEEPGTGQARYAVELGHDRIVAVGGDGTARLVAGALAEARAGEQATADVSLGVVPVGTANLFARSARLPVHDVRAAARLAVTGAGRATDLGQVELTTSTGAISTHPFLVVAGLGHDAATLAEVRPGSKSRVRWLAYFLPGLRRLRRPGHRLTLTLDGQQVQVGTLWSVLAVNAARLPAGAQVVPGARLDDGVLHVALVSPAGLRGWVRVARTGLVPRSPRSTAAGYPRDHRALAYRGAHDLVVEAADPVPAQVDGDVVPDVVRAELSLRLGAVAVAR